MKNVILHYPSNKTYKEHKFKVAGADPSSVLRKRISAELPIFKDCQYLLILKKYDSYLSFLQEDKPFNKLFNENRIHIQLFVPPKEAEIILPNQSAIHLSIDFTKSVSENIKDLINYLQKTNNSYSIKINEDYIFESYTFFFAPTHSISDGFDDSPTDNSNNENNINSPKIASSSLPLLFQGWSGERLTLIRRITATDLLIADEKWKIREKQIEKMKQSFEESKNNALQNSNKMKYVKFTTNLDQDDQHLSLIEKSKSTNTIDFSDQDIEAFQNDDDNNNENNNNNNNNTNLPFIKNTNGKSSSDEKYFDFITEEFFYNCQLAVLNKLCTFNLNTWCSLACLQCIASHGNLKHTQIQNLLPFIPDSVQNAAKDNELSSSTLTNTITEMKKKYSKFEKMQAMRTYIQLCVEKGESFCYSEGIKFLLLTKKWRVSSHRIIYISPNKISIAKDENSTEFLHQSNISNIISLSFDGDFIIITFEIFPKNDQSSIQQNPGTLPIQMEKWRIKSHHPQILIYMINELRSIFYQSSRTLSNLPGTSPSLSKIKSTDFRNLVSAQHRAKSSGMLRNFIIKPGSSILAKDENNTSISIHKDNSDDNNIIQSDFSDTNVNDFYFDKFEPSIEFDSDFVEPGISKLICPLKEDAAKPCIDLLVREQGRNLKLLKRLCLPYKIDNIKSNSEKSLLSLNSYSGLDNMSEIPDINWILDINNLISISQKNGKIILIIGVLIIFLFICTLFK